MTDQGIELRGRLGGINDGKALFSGGFRNACNLADLKMRRLLKLVDEWVDENGAEAGEGSPDDFEATRVEDDTPLQLDLRSGEIATVLWATGYKADYSWLDMDLIDWKGRLRHDGGVVTEAPGLYLIGTTFLRRRKSTFIHGAEDDANDLADHIAGYLAA